MTASELEARLRDFAKTYPCLCDKNYPGATEYHGHDCQSDVAQEFVEQFLASLKGEN